MITTIVVFVLFIAVQVVAYAAALLCSHWDKLGSFASPDTLVPSSVALGTAMLVGEALLALGLWYWFYRLEPSARGERGRNTGMALLFHFEPLRHDLPTRRVSWLTTVEAVCAMLIFAVGIDAVLQGLGISDPDTSKFFEGMKESPWCILLLCLVGPLCEELIFRVGILRPLYRQGLSAWLCVGLSALLFGLAHGNLWQGIPAVLGGIVLGIYYIRSGNLRLCLPAHVANNVLAVVLLYLPDDKPPIPVWAGVLHIVVAAALIIHLYTYKNQPKAPAA